MIARPRGTEPKLKVYIDVREEVAPGEPLSQAKSRALARHSALADDFSRLAGL